MEKDILQDIIAQKREEVARQQEAVSLDQLIRLTENLPEGRSMKQALAASPHASLPNSNAILLPKDGFIRKPIPPLSRLHTKKQELQHSPF